MYKSKHKQVQIHFTFSSKDRTYAWLCAMAEGSDHIIQKMI